MSKLNLSWVGNAARKVLTFGKKNAPALMTGSSILLGWGAAYVFWKQSKKAEEFIRKEEQDNGEELEKKEKFIIYLKYCWMAAAMGLGSTGLTIWAHEMDWARLAEMYMITQFLEGKNEDQEKLIEKMKGEMKKGSFERIQDELREEKYPMEELKKELPNIPGTGRTLFIDETMLGKKFRDEVDAIKNRIWEFNAYADKQRENLIERRKNSAFYVSDNPYPDIGVYIDIPLTKFLRFIGETDYEPTYDDGIGGVNVFRYSGGGVCVNPDDIMDYKKFIDPDTGVAAVCYLSYRNLLKPSADYMDEMT